MVLDRHDEDDELVVDVRTTAASMPLFEELRDLCARDRPRFRRVASGIATQLRKDAEHELCLSADMLNRLADLLDRASHVGNLSEVFGARRRPRAAERGHVAQSLRWQFVLARAGRSYRSLSQVA